MGKLAGTYSKIVILHGFDSCLCFKINAMDVPKSGHCYNLGVVGFEGDRSNLFVLMVGY